MIDQNFIIYWQQNIGKTYMYGSSINYLTKNHVIFENNLFPSGSCIHSWTSLGNYQTHRSASQLPMLEKGYKYNIKIDAATTPQNTLYIQFKFYDRYENLIEVVTIKDKQGSFVYPSDAHYYELSLINGGLQEIIFHNLVITNDEFIIKNRFFEYDGLFVSNILNEKSESQRLQILFAEPVIGNTAIIPKHIIEQFSDVVLVTSSKLYAHFYMSNEYEKKILGMIAKLQKNYEISSIHFIGYGPISSTAAVYYSNKTTRGEAYITSDCGQLSLSRDMLYTDGYQKFEQEKLNSSNTSVHIYSHVPPLEPSLELVKTLLNPSSRLQEYLNLVNN